MAQTTSQETASNDTVESLDAQLDLGKIEHVAEIFMRLPMQTAELLWSDPGNEQLIKYYTNMVISQLEPHVKFVNKHNQILTTEQLENEARNCLGSFLEEVDVKSFSVIQSEFENQENRLYDAINHIQRLQQTTIKTIQDDKEANLNLNVHLKKMMASKEELVKALEIHVEQCRHCLACYETELEEIRLRTTGAERTELTRNVQEVQAKMRHFLQQTTSFQDRLIPITIPITKQTPTVPEPAYRISSNVIVLVEEKMRSLDVIQKKTKAWLSEFKNDFLPAFVDKLLDDLFGLCSRNHFYCSHLIDMDTRIRRVANIKTAALKDILNSLSSTLQDCNNSRRFLNTLTTMRTEFNAHQIESCAMFVAQINRITQIAAGHPSSGRQRYVYS